MKEKIEIVTETDTGCHIGIIIRTHFQDFTCKNKLALFASLLTLLQKRTLLHSKLFCRGNKVLVAMKDKAIDERGWTRSPMRNF